MADELGKAFYGEEGWTRMTTPPKPRLKDKYINIVAAIVIACLTAVIIVMSFALCRFLLS